MLTHLRPALVLTLLFSLLLGLAYPLGITGIAQLTMPWQANGSLVVKEGAVVGSDLIAQGFIGPGYFHPRPSAVDYNAGGSGGSNLGPLSQKLINRVTVDVAGGQSVPADAVTTSASGLDPDISPANALAQVARVASARGMDTATVAKLVAVQTEGRRWGIFGEPRVNVLRLNLALDKAAAR